MKTFTEDMKTFTEVMKTFTEVMINWVDTKVILDNTPIDKEGLKLVPIEVKEEYLKEWNESSNNFKVLTYNGELLRNVLYHEGGIGQYDTKKPYLMLLRYEEAYYDKKILKISKSNRAKHLKGCWCILDNKGNEKYICKETINHPYLVSDSCIYTINSKYYNIETGYCYGESYHKFETSNYVFINNEYDDDITKRGVIKIHKLDGTFELIN